MAVYPVLCALACLAVAIGAPAVPDVCNPHLILKDGTRMKDDVRSHFNWNSSCFGSTLLILLSEKGGFINAITTTGGTPYCRGLVQLLSLVEAYGWTGNMCLNKSLHFSGEKKPCDSTDDVFLQLNDWNRKLTDMKYDGLADVVNQMMVTLGGSRCLDTCGGYLGSQLCSTLIKAVGYFVVKYDEEKISAENSIHLPSERKSEIKSSSAGGQSTMQTSASLTKGSLDIDRNRTLYKFSGRSNSGLINKSMQTANHSYPTHNNASKPLINPSRLLVNHSGTHAPVKSDASSGKHSVQVPPSSDDHSLPSTKDDLPPPFTNDDLHPPSSKDDLPPLTPNDDLPSLTTDDVLHPLTPNDDLRPPPSNDGEDYSDTDPLGSRTANRDGTRDHEDDLDMGLDQFSDTQNDDVIPGDRAPHAGSEDINGKYPAIANPTLRTQKGGVTVSRMGLVKAEEKVMEEEEEEEEEVGGGHGTLYFVTLFMVAAVVVMVGYLAVHNRKKIRENMTSKSKGRRSRSREYKPLLGQS